MIDCTDVIMGRPHSFNNAVELWAKCKEYFTSWEAQKRPLNVVGLAVYLDVCKDTLNEYGKGTYDHLDIDFSVTVKKAKNYIENHKWEKALVGEYQHSVAIFDLKNNHGAVDRVELLGKDQSDLMKAQQEKPTIVVHSPDAATAAQMYQELLKTLQK